MFDADDPEVAYLAEVAAEARERVEVMLDRHWGSPDPFDFEAASVAADLASNDWRFGDPDNPDVLKAVVDDLVRRANGLDVACEGQLELWP